MRSRHFLYLSHLIILVGWTSFVVYNFLGTSLQKVQPQESISDTEMINNFLKQDNILTKNENLESNDRVSLNDIIASINIQDLSGSLISTKELEQQYRSSNDPEIGIQFITKLSKEFNYKQAYKELQTLDSTTIKTMDPHLVLRIFLNSELINNKNQNLTPIENIIGEFSANNLITQPEAQRYKALIMLIK